MATPAQNSVRLSAAGRALFALIACAALGAYLYTAGREYLALRLGHSGDPSRIMRAVTLTPDNAELHEWLGLYHVYLGESDRGIAELRTASALQPYNSQLWLDLAVAYQFPGRVGEQEQALEQALTVDPTTPSVLWEAANFYLVAGNAARAYPLFRRIISDDPSRAAAAIDLLWRSSHDVRALFDGEAVPPRTNAYLALLDSVTRAHVTPDPADPTRARDLAAADVVWERLVALHQPIRAQGGFVYLALLIRAGNTERAARVWREMAELDPAVQARIAGNGELVSNGSFEQDPLQGGFDWQYSSQDAVRLSLDSAMARTGLRSLRMDFQGPPVTFIPCVQNVIVEPGAHYHFSGFVRSRDLLTTSGPRLIVTDGQTGAVLFRSDDILGTDGWREEYGDFTTGPNTRLLLVSVMRDPGDRRIEGTAWIDDVSLTRQP